MKPLSLQFVDAFALSVKHPETFEVPSFEDLNSIEPGDCVKVCLDQPGHGGERFWCSVKEVDVASRTIIGEVDNNLVNYNYPVCTKVEIKFNHIYQIMK